MHKRYFTALIFLSIFINSFSQNFTTINGVIKGLGTGKKVILGNKPNGINPGFIFIKYDSTISYNDSFQFKNIKFQTPAYYSLDFENCMGWTCFFGDTGTISIIGTSESVYN
ncbi:MAG: DUF4369 domain-containing protein, partial [Ferruginibacter sp.]